MAGSALSRRQLLAVAAGAPGAGAVAGPARATPIGKAVTVKGQYLREGVRAFDTLTLHVSRTALLLVDVYYDDQDKGRWAEPGEPMSGHFERMEKSIAVAAEAARAVGMAVVYAMNSAPKIAVERSAFGAHFTRAWSRDRDPGQFNREFAEGGVDPREYHGGREAPLKIPPSLAPRPGDYYVRKHTYSGFFDTRLDTTLRNLGIDTVVSAGLWANVCLAATALDALYRNYRVVWLRDGTLAGEREPTGDVRTLANTARWVDWFEDVVGYTVASHDLASACTSKTP